jgi:hypothetical protein
VARVSAGVFGVSLFGDGTRRQSKNRGAGNKKATRVDADHVELPLAAASRAERRLTPARRERPVRGRAHRAAARPPHPAGPVAGPDVDQNAS